MLKSAQAFSLNYDHASSRTDWYMAAVESLVDVIQELSEVKDIDSIIGIVRNAARRLTRADGATFVLRDGQECHYVDEDAIGPLWKGKHFPMSTCISGWVMQNATQAVIEDIYADSRIPADAYRPTFVKSLAMVPIRQQSPIGAIGNYWASNHKATPEEVAILQALADTTSVAMENARLYAELKAKMRSLQESNYDLSRFAWVASHDLKESLGVISDSVDYLSKHCLSALDKESQERLSLASSCAKKLRNEMDNLLVHARIEKIENFKPVCVEQIINETKQEMHSEIVQSGATITLGNMPWLWGDAALLKRLFQNLLSNAIKFRKAGARPQIHIDCQQKGNELLFSIHDNGIGIDPMYKESIFRLFNRLHTQDRYPGSGIGLATCQKIVEKHGGKIWVESIPGQGSSFFFTHTLQATS